MGTLGTMCSSPSTASTRIGSFAPPASPAPPAPLAFLGFVFSRLTSSDQTGNPPMLHLRAVASHQSRFFSASCRCCARCVPCTQPCNRGIVNPSSPSGSTHLLRNSRTFVKHVTFDMVQNCDSALRRVLTNRQQRFAHGCLNTTNYETRSPIVITINVQLIVRLDKLSSGCAESEIHNTKNPLPVCGALGPYRLSCNRVDSQY